MQCTHPPPVVTARYCLQCKTSDWNHGIGPGTRLVASPPDAVHPMPKITHHHGLFLMCNHSPDPTSAKASPKRSPSKER